MLFSYLILSHFVTYVYYPYIRIRIFVTVGPLIVSTRTNQKFIISVDFLSSWGLDTFLLKPIYGLSFLHGVLITHVKFFCVFGRVFPRVTSLDPVILIVLLTTVITHIVTRSLLRDSCVTTLVYSFYPPPLLCREEMLSYSCWHLPQYLSLLVVVYWLLTKSFLVVTNDLITYVPTPSCPINVSEFDRGIVIK